MRRKLDAQELEDVQDLKEEIHHFQKAIGKMPKGNNYDYQHALVLKEHVSMLKAELDHMLHAGGKQ